MVEGLVVHHAVPDYLLLTDAALLLGVLPISRLERERGPTLDITLKHLAQ